MTRTQEPATHQPIPQTLARIGCLALIALCVAVNSIQAAAGELSVHDFKFDGPNGPQGASIESDKPQGPKVSWNEGPRVQFGNTNVLCEGAGNWTSKADSL